MVTGSEVVPLHGVLRDKKIIALAAEFAAKKAQAALLDGRLKELKPILEAAMKGQPSVYVGVHVLSRTDVPAVPATPNRIITRDMVGGVLPGSKGRAAYTQLKIL